MSPMPAKRACIQPGCAGLADYRGRCAKHARKAEEFRGSAYARGYDRTWQRVRAGVLRSEPLCRHCMQAGRITPATDVHHEVRVKDDPSRRLDTENLVPLCQSCHSRVTLAEDVRDVLR